MTPTPMARPAQNPPAVAELSCGSFCGCWPLVSLESKDEWMPPPAAPLAAPPVLLGAAAWVASAWSVARSEVAGDDPEDFTLDLPDAEPDELPSERDCRDALPLLPED